MRESKSKRERCRTRCFIVMNRDAQTNKQQTGVVTVDKNQLDEKKWIVSRLCLCTQLFYVFFFYRGRFHKINGISSLESKINWNQTKKIWTFLITRKHICKLHAYGKQQMGSMSFVRFDFRFWKWEKSTKEETI